MTISKRCRQLVIEHRWTAFFSPLFWGHLVYLLSAAETLSKNPTSLGIWKSWLSEGLKASKWKATFLWRNIFGTAAEEDEKAESRRRMSFAVVIIQPSWITLYSRWGHQWKLDRCQYLAVRCRREWGELPASNIKVLLIIVSLYLCPESKDEMSGVWQKFGLEEKVPINVFFDLIVYLLLLLFRFYIK